MVGPKPFLARERLLMTRSMQLFVVALVALLLPTSLLAQQGSAPAAQAQQPTQEVQAWFMELQQISGKLGEIQVRALQDPELQAAQNMLGTEVKAAMDKVDPGLAASVERVGALEQEAMKAQQEGDQAKLAQLAQEAQQIQTRFVTAQSTVLEQPELAAKVEAFQTRLERRMIEVDPEARTLIQRLRELETKLQTAMQQPASR